MGSTLFSGMTGASLPHRRLPLCQQWQHIFLVMAAASALNQKWQDIMTATAQVTTLDHNPNQPLTYDTSHKLGQNLPDSGITTLLCGLGWGLWCSNHSYAPLATFHLNMPPLMAAVNATYDHEVLPYDKSLLGVVHFLHVALTHDPYGEPYQWLGALRQSWQSLLDANSSEADKLPLAAVMQEIDGIGALLKNVSPISAITEYLHSNWSVALYLILSNPWQPKLSLQRVNLLEHLPPIAPLRAEVSLLVQVWLAVGGIYRPDFPNLSPEDERAARAKADQWFSFWSGAMPGVNLSPTTLVALEPG